MQWAIHRTRRYPPMHAREPQLVTLTKGDISMLRYGAGYFGGLTAFTFKCPGPCAAVYDVRPRQRQSFFDAKTQRFRCPDCRIELQLSILAEILPPPLSKQDAAEYEANLLGDFAACPPDARPTAEQAASMRRGGE